MQQITFVRNILNANQIKTELKSTKKETTYYEEQRCSVDSMLILQPQIGNKTFLVCLFSDSVAGDYIMKQLIDIGLNKYWYFHN